MTTKALRCGFWGVAGLLLLSATARANAAGCAFEPQGEGRVVAVIDARTIRLDDGREVRLAGIVPIASDKTKAAAALTAVVSGREVTLRGFRNAGAKRVAAAGRGAGFDRDGQQGLRRGTGGRRGRGEAG
jgi:hypothetical protein